MRSLNDVLKKSGSIIYNEMVHVALTSAIGSAVLAFLVLYLPFYYALLLLPLLYMPLVYGALYAYHRKTLGEKLLARNVFVGAAKGFFPAAVFGYLMALLLFILISTWWYYHEQDSLLYLVVALFQTYFAVAVLISQFYTLQLVLQENMGIFRAMGTSVKLFFRHPGYTTGAFFQAAVVLAALLVTVVGFGLLYVGSFAIFQHEAAYNVLHPEEKKDEEEDSAERQGKS